MDGNNGTYKMTSYFTFGQTHEHSVNGITVNRDVVVKITAEDPSKVMTELFGTAWAMEYPGLPDLAFYPGGVLELGDGAAVLAERAARGENAAVHTKMYLGDSVYCEFDGYAFVLTTENGEGPSNTIVLEPDVLQALMKFAQRVKEPWDGTYGAKGTNE